MSTTISENDVLDSALSAVATVIPLSMRPHHKPLLVHGSYVQASMGVLIAVIGELQGRLVLDASAATFSDVAEAMYGVTLEAEMLESFVGEIGNMVAGNAVSTLSNLGITVNISPPTVLVGETKIAGFQRGVHLPLELSNSGEMNVVWMTDERK
ncbi:chemotaxis protein CheX [Alicyclobacillus ferrooxydans]|uniref:Chemotaxis phosphatase CheX-like domain-containing protein n=1 Tax=Alicyclobacillus ferrooxydans TaxID=471514 RepID=A0A0P9ELZ4_9BACL|nr:chemotaxis protein CheX [Alicyclobacillus ferrooxydans]KPV44347.1 hypothetical protein AN477_06830 [Alicyclobacillus ferrooxydans]